MKKVSKTIISLLLSLICLFSFAIPIYAADEELILNVSALIAGLQSAHSFDANGDLVIQDVDDTIENDLGLLSKFIPENYTNTEALWKNVIRYSGGCLYMHNGFDIYTTGERIKIITEFYTYLNDSGVSAYTRQAIYNRINARIGNDVAAAVPEIVEATSANIVGAMAVWGVLPFQSWLGIILGVITIIIILGLVLGTAIDCAYLLSPGMFRGISDAIAEGRNPWFVSTEAVNTAKEEALGNVRGNVLAYYLKKRTLVFIILAVCVVYLVSGQIWTLIQGLFHLVSGVTGIE